MTDDVVAVAAHEIRTVVVAEERNEVRLVDFCGLGLGADQDEALGGVVYP